MWVSGVIRSGVLWGFMGNGDSVKKMGDGCLLIVEAREIVRLIFIVNCYMDSFFFDYNLILYNN